MGLWKLRLSIMGTLAAIIGLSTLFITALLTWIGTFNWIFLGVLVVGINVAQWLLAPYLIDAMYKVQEISGPEDPKLYNMVERLSRQSGIEMPKVMVAEMAVPNAFAYGSPIAGKRVAVTTKLRETLEDEEIEAVIGHELGHLKHRDVQVMMFVSLLPALFYYIGYSMLLSAGYGRRSERGGGAAMIGLASILLYWILTLFTLHLSRLREYYADRHSATIIDEGPRKLSEGLAKIVESTGRIKRRHRDTGSVNSFKALFIADPDRAESDTVSLAHASAYSADQKLVQEVVSREVTTFDRVAELFSSHPNIVKRLRALQETA